MHTIWLSFDVMWGRCKLGLLTNCPSTGKLIGHNHKRKRERERERERESEREGERGREREQQQQQQIYSKQLLISVASPII